MDIYTDYTTSPSPWFHDVEPSHTEIQDPTKSTKLSTTISTTTNEGAFNKTPTDNLES